MDTGEWLSDFYDAIGEDPRIGVSHISLYVCLVRQLQLTGQVHFLLVNRTRMAAMAKISRRTYNKCMRDLVAFGYIRYEPSTNPSIGSKVYLNRL